MKKNNLRSLADFKAYFDFAGERQRLNYLGVCVIELTVISFAMLFVFAISSNIISGILSMGFLVLVLMPLSIWLFGSTARQRARNCGITGLWLNIWTVVAMIPYLNILAIWLLFCPPKFYPCPPLYTYPGLR